MKHFTTSAALLLCVAAGSAVAQAPVQQQAAAAPQQQQPVAAARDIDPNALAGAALRILQTIDRQQTGALWDSASAVAKRATKREEFVTRVITTRKPMGAVAGRSWTAVRRQQVPDGDALPAGVYGSIEFASQYQDGKTHRELVSMRRDEDGTWRFVGYVVE